MHLITVLRRRGEHDTYQGFLTEHLTFVFAKQHMEKYSVLRNLMFKSFKIFLLLILSNLLFSNDKNNNYFRTNNAIFVKNSQFIIRQINVEES